MTAGSYSFQLGNADHTRESGALLGKALLNASNDQPIIIHLVGELGAGKTTFVGGLLKAMGHNDSVRSPTYTLIEPYELTRAGAITSTLQVVHMDLYRLTDPSQLEELGIRDMLVANTVLLIEWPDRAGQYLPLADVVIHLSYSEDGRGRKMDVAASNERAERLLQQAYSHTVRP